jgi:putative flippase GtrA
MAAAVGLVTNFSLNHLLNFRFRQRSAIGQFRTFCLVAGVGVLLTSAISTGLRSLLFQLAGAKIQIWHFGVETDFAAHFLAVGLVVLYSYPAHKLITFNIGIRARFQQLNAAVWR